MKNIIICSTQRCGSTMVCDDFRTTGVLGNPEEYINFWILEKRMNIDWFALLPLMAKKNASENGLFSIKIMSDQIIEVERRIRHCRPNLFSSEDAPPYASQYFYDAFKDYLWVKVERKAINQQAISREISRQTGICHATRNENIKHFAGSAMQGFDDEYNAGVKYNYKKIMKHRQNIKIENHRWDRFFEFWKIEPLILTYEDIVNNRNYLHVVAEKAGVKVDEIKPRISNKLSNKKKQRMVGTTKE